MTDIKSMTQEELGSFLKSLGQPAFRAKQVFTWLHRGVTSFDEMTNLPKTLREQLAQTCHITAPFVARRQESKLDGTIKYLWELADGSCIETVLMQLSPRQHRLHLLAGGLPHGLRLLREHHRRQGARPDRLGDARSGALYAAGFRAARSPTSCSWASASRSTTATTSCRFLELVNHPDGLHIGMRHISLSTCGIVPGIEWLAEQDLQLTLSVSLHAPDSETRSRIMPVNRAYDVGGAVCRLSPVFQKDRAAHLL